MTNLSSVRRFSISLVLLLGLLQTATSAIAAPNAKQVVKATSETGDRISMVSDFLDNLGGATKTSVNPGVVKGGASFFDWANVALKTARSYSKSGSEATFTLLKEGSATALSNFSGAEVGAAFTAAAVGWWGPGWAAIGGTVVGYGAKKLVGSMITGGMDFVRDNLRSPEAKAMSLAGFKRARAREKWIRAVMKDRWNPLTKAELDRWESSYGQESDFAPSSGNLDVPTYARESEVIGRWKLDTDALLASASVVAKRLGRSEDSLRSVFERFYIEIEVDEDGTLRQSGTDPGGGSLDASAHWKLQDSGCLRLSKRRGKKIPGICLEKGRLRLHAAAMGGMVLLFDRR